MRPTSPQPTAHSPQRIPAPLPPSRPPAPIPTLRRQGPLTVRLRGRRRDHETPFRCCFIRLQPPTFGIRTRFFPADNRPHASLHSREPPHESPAQKKIKKPNCRRDLCPSAGLSLQLHQPFEWSQLFGLNALLTSTCRRLASCRFVCYRTLEASCPCSSSPSLPVPVRFGWHRHPLQQTTTTTTTPPQYVDGFCIERARLTISPPTAFSAPSMPARYTVFARPRHIRPARTRKLTVEDRQVGSEVQSKPNRNQVRSLGA